MNFSYLLLCLLPADIIRHRSCPCQLLFIMAKKKKKKSISTCYCIQLMFFAENRQQLGTSRSSSEFLQGRTLRERSHRSPSFFATPLKASLVKDSYKLLLTMSSHRICRCSSQSFFITRHKKRRENSEK